jgi:hypothetical protein
MAACVLRRWRIVAGRGQCGRGWPTNSARPCDADSHSSGSLRSSARIRPNTVAALRPGESTWKDRGFELADVVGRARRRMLALAGTRPVRSPRAAVTALVFGLAHGLLAALPVLTIFGVLLALLRSRNESIYPPDALPTLSWMQSTGDSGATQVCDGRLGRRATRGGQTGSDVPDEGCYPDCGPWRGRGPGLRQSPGLDCTEFVANARIAGATPLLAGSVTRQPPVFSY